MKRVIFISGLPGVGKSTFARRIAEKVNGIVLDIDDIKKEVVDARLVRSTIDPPEVRWQCYEKAAEQISLHFEKGASTVVVDEVFHLHDLRQKLENICISNGEEVLWVEIRCPPAEVERRLRSNSGRNGHILSTDETLKMHELFLQIFEDFPSGKINHHIFINDGSCDLNDFVI